MYVRLRSIQYVSINGEQKTFNPGDWVDVGRQTAMLWLSTGQAELPQLDVDLLPPSSCFCSINGASLKPGGINPAVIERDIEIVNAEHPVMERQLNCISDRVAVKVDLYWVGVSMLHNTGWQVIVPLDHEQLLVECASGDRVEQVREKIGDLRIPVYDPRLMFIKKSPETIELLDAFMGYRKALFNRWTAFMLALWDVKPLILPVPMDWIRS